MTTKYHFLSDEVEFEALRLHQKQKCSTSSYLKVILLIVSASLAFTFTIVYYGIFLGTEEMLQSSMNIHLLQEPGEAIPSVLASNAINDPMNTRNLKPVKMSISPSGIRRRRDLVQNDVIDPMESDFDELRAKIRDRRTNIELSTLAKDYEKCKRESFTRRECMKTFNEMYKIAKDVSDKMDKMKEIFRDSEMHLHQDSMSSSMEKLDIDKSTKTTNKSTSVKPPKQHGGKKIVLYEDGLEVDNITLRPKLKEDYEESLIPIENSTLKATTLDPWNASTNDAVNYYSTTVERNNTMPSFYNSSMTYTIDLDTLNATTNQMQPSIMHLKEVTTALKTMDLDPTTATITGGTGTTEQLHIDSGDTDEHSTTEVLKASSIEHSTMERFEENSATTENDNFPNLKVVTQPFSTSKVYSSTESSNFKDLDMITPSVTNATTEEAQEDYKTDDSIIADANTTTPIVETFTTKPLPDKSPAMTLDWGQFVTITTASSTEPSQSATTEAPNHGERDFQILPPSFKTRVSNHTTDIKITYGGKCGATNYEYKTPIVHCPFTNQNGTTFSPQVSTDHPLDFPSSRENMLDSDAAVKQIEQQPLTPKSTELHDKWMQKFQAGSIGHGKNSSGDTKPHTELMESFDQLDPIRVDKFGPKMNPTNIVHGGNNQQLMTLCEHLAQKMRDKVATPAPDKNDDLTPSPNIQFTSRGPGFPVTGETMKASAQFLINPNFGVPSIPVCFYITPASFRMMMQPFWSPFFGMQGMGSGNGVNSGNSGGGVFIIPPSFGNMQNNGNFFGHSSPTGGGSQSNIPNIFSKSVSSQQNDSTQKQQQFFCTYMQNGGKQSPGSAGGSGFNNVNFKLRNSSGNNSSPIDIIYSSYWNKLPSYYGSNRDREDQFHCPLNGDVPCYGGDECIPEKKWCDSTVDCSDGSDEAACTCRERMQEHRICDGYQDCPLGEDEIGCFGCNKFMYSCYDNNEEFHRANRSTLAMCYSSKERCDGVKNCINGRDEGGCNLIVNDLTNHMSHAVSGSAGYLYHNYHGDWYPVCNNAQKWAQEACTEELGDLITDPVVTFENVAVPGPFIEPHQMGGAHFPQSCQKRERDVLSDQVAHVRCPLPTCGIVQESTSPLMRSRRRRRRRDVTAEKDSRIVGGSYSKPIQWPFIVALYRNGIFHCGGTIFNEHWIISAAHCTIGFKKYFYEVRAGMLRRSSFSSATQIHHVTHVVVHQDYERHTMKNDLALLRIDTPLRYNRWVKPICLPDQGRTTMGADWIWGPEAGTICTVVGWGAIREKGAGSDRLKEVHLPIRKRCTEKDDQEAEDICAGDVLGGKDACQGDSGGPLFCRSVSNSKQWYLAGVVSHGNGCARPSEFGVYTRVALYLDWIEMALKPEYLPKAQPKQSCPGYVCIWGGKRCIAESKRCDRLVDCLGGEDEVGCVYNYIPDVGAALLNATTTPMMHDSESTDQEQEATTAGSGFNSKNLLGNLNGSGGDTEASSLETADNKKLTTMDIEMATETTNSSHPGLKSLLDWPSEQTETVPVSSTTATTRTTTWTLPEPITTEQRSSSSTPLPTSAIELTKLQDLAVKFLDALDKVTTEGFNTETIPITTSSVATAESTQTTEGSGFGEFKAILPDVTSENPTTIHKRENATEDEGTSTMPAKTMPKNIPHKFVCEKIPQIIDLSNRCDRIWDCEDGTDEEGCTCRQYLKGPLNILICDGKIDCGDFSDEDDCGNCTANEFLCPLSKTCIDSMKRCDDVIDCQYKEDEQDCFALTNGREIHLDTNKQPSFQSAGIFSRNKHGTWNVVCSHETGFHSHSAKTAEELCSLLGFKGFLFYNTTEITRHPTVPIEPDFLQKSYLKGQFSVGDSVHFTDGSRPYGITLSRSEGGEKITQNCLGLYVECVPKTNGSAPIKTITPGDEISPKTFGLKPDGNLTMAEIFAKNKDQILDKLIELIEKKNTVLVHDKLHESLEKWHWPWLVDVYTNGELWCVGVLLDKHWVLVHDSCYNGVRLDIDYVTVLLGGGKSKHILHKSPHEQIKRVDCFEVVDSSDVLLLHLDYAAHFTRHVLPTFLPDISLTEKEKHKVECMSVVHDKFGGIKVTPTIGKSAATARDGEQAQNNASSTICSGDNELSCYQWDPAAIIDFKLKYIGIDEMLASANEQEEVKSLSDFCKNIESSTSYPHNQGVIVCRDDNTGWYPMAFYNYNATECNNLKQPFPVRTLEKYYKHIQHIVDQPKCGYGYTKPYCPTLRCPLGNCLLPEQMCNGKVDCHDGSDEEKEFCRLHRNDCKASELKCRSNGKCIPKTKFCDHIADCEDLTDEPTICSCFTYLQATDPTKICDGIRNCWDKSDESPVLCNCTTNRFPCGSSPSECIPKDFVCDKEPDCPNGEDEQFCYGIEHPIMPPTNMSQSTKPTTFPKGYGQVIEQSYGVWHTKCFPRKRPPDSVEFLEICHKLGYRGSKQPSYRIIDDNTDIVGAAGVHDGDEVAPRRYRDATKAAVINKFSPLHLNDDLTLILKPSRPIAELVKWNETDSKNCYRLEIKCG